MLNTLMFMFTTNKEIVMNEEQLARIEAKLEAILKLLEKKQ